MGVIALDFGLVVSSFMELKFLKSCGPIFLTV